MTRALRPTHVASLAVGRSLPRHLGAPRHRRSGLKVVLALIAALIVLGAVFTAVQLLRGAPQPTLTRFAHPDATVPGRLALPDVGAEVTVALLGAGDLESVGGTAETPIASVTKLMSALVVLHDHPLAPGQSGPEIPVSAADVQTYLREKAAQDSVVAVQAGEQLSEYQALEAALVPSADNVIEMLAVWDAGSEAAFVAKMNAEAHPLGLTHTHYADASGVDPNSVSDAADQARLAELALKNKTIAGIVGQPQVTLPVAGLQYNVNADLGRDGIFGVKTGWVPAGGASFVFAAHRAVAGATRTILGAIIGVHASPNLPSALADARTLVVAAGRALAPTTIVGQGTTVARVSAPWASPLAVVTGSPARLVAWPGATAHVSVALSPDALHTPIVTGERLGRATVALGTERVSVPLVAASSLPAVSTSWRLLHL